MKFTVSDQIIGQLRELLSERIGYILPPEFRAFVVRQLKVLLTELRLDDPDFLVQQLTLERAESPLWLRFISRMTIGESYLFRNPSHMEVLQQVILPTLLARSKRQPVTMWSAGCSRGEEPYTLAILLHELDPQASDRPISIVGTDIDTEALSDARKATYGAWAFRQTPFYIQRKYFTKQRNDKLMLRAEVAKMVRFAQHHLAQNPPPDLLPAGGCDLIICRNVMMYFRDDFRERAGKVLAHSLSSQGVLLTGQVEKVEGVSNLLDRHFVYNTPIYSHLPAGGSIELINLLKAGREPSLSDKINSSGLLSRPITGTGFSAQRLSFNTPPGGTKQPIKRPISTTLPAVSSAPQPEAPKSPQAPLSSREKQLLSPWQMEAAPPGGNDPLAMPVLVAPNDAPDPNMGSLPEALRGLSMAKIYEKIHACICAGQIAEAKQYCAALIASDPMQASHYCLSAMVALENNDPSGAADGLRRATYCDPDSLTGFYLWWLIGIRYHGQRWERTRWAKRHLERLIAPLIDAHPVPLLSGVTVGDIRYLLARRWDAFDA